MSQRGNARTGVWIAVAIMVAAPMAYFAFHDESEDARYEPVPASVGSPDTTDEVDEFIVNMEWGSGILRVPKTMELYQTERVDFSISRSLSTEQLGERLGTYRQKPQTFPLKVSKDMGAMLSGTEFKVAPAEKVRQRVPRSTITQWKWSVVPTASGEQDLELDIFAFIDEGSGEAPLPLETYSRRVKVQVTPATFIAYAKDHPDVLGLSVASVGGALWKFVQWWRKRGKPPA